jgi:fibronectin type 3 domain-containing protein
MADFRKLLFVLIVAALLFPSLVMAQAAHSVTLTWAWTQGTGGAATGFNVKRALVTGGPYTTIQNVPSPTTFTCVDTTSLVEGTTYYYVVTTTGNGGTESVPSNEAAGTIPFSVPNAPTKPTLVVK